jgi:hypothetical protein
MAIPKYDEMTLPILQALSDGEEHARAELIDRITHHFNLKPEDQALTHPNWKTSYLKMRIGWAAFALTQADLATETGGGALRITNTGRQFLATNPTGKLGRAALKQFESFRRWSSETARRAVATRRAGGLEVSPPESAEEGATAAVVRLMTAQPNGNAETDPQNQRMNNELGEQIQMEGEESDESPDLSKTTKEREILTKAGDPEVCALHDRYKRGKLILQPDFQRQFVWDRKKSSRLIESILLSVPLPIIYLSEQPDGKEYVIDGQQRLTSLFAFIDGKFPAGDEFKLTGLNPYKELNKRAFSELTEELQDKILHYTLRSVTLLKQSNSDLKFEIFERLNTGSEPLNDQELRNCVYRGPYNRLLKDLASDLDFRDLLGLKAGDRRMKDVELVLRFAAFFHATYLKYQPPMKRFFNNDMEKYQYLTDSDASLLRAAFKNSVQIIKSLFGNERAFKRFYAGDQSNPVGRWEPKKFNASLYDILMGVFHDKDKNQVYAALDSLREGIIDLMATNRDFNDAIELGTSAIDSVKRRFDLMREVVEGVLKDHKIQPRCFSQALKQELFDHNPTCGLCNQTIQQVDDAAVDHIEQYWRGGKTIPENARLAHRYCNCARPRAD